MEVSVFRAGEEALDHVLHDAAEGLPLHVAHVDLIGRFRSHDLNHKSLDSTHLTVAAALLQEALNPDCDVGEAEHLIEAHGAAAQQVGRLLAERPPRRALVRQMRQAVLAA